MARLSGTSETGVDARSRRARRMRPLLAALGCVVLAAVGLAILVQAQAGAGTTSVGSLALATATVAQTDVPATAAPTATPTTAPAKYQAPKVVKGGGGPPPSPPAPHAVPPGPDPYVAMPNQGGQVILINIAQQWLWAINDRKLVYRMPVTTGMPQLPTPTGRFSVRFKEADVTFISPWPPGSPYYYAPEHINYALYFADDGYYLHDAPWRHCFGPGTNVPHTCPDGTKETGSHGCVNLRTRDAAWLYNWARNGAAVYIVNVAAPPTPTPSPSPSTPTPTPIVPTATPTTADLTETPVG